MVLPDRYIEHGSSIGLSRHYDEERLSVTHAKDTAIEQLGNDLDFINIVHTNDGT